MEKEEIQGLRVQKASIFNSFPQFSSISAEDCREIVP